LRKHFIAAARIMEPEAKEKLVGTDRPHIAEF
jgi:hypothetical protein